MSLSTLTPTQAQIRQEHIERRMRIASRAVKDTGIDLRRHLAPEIAPVVEIAPAPVLMVPLPPVRDWLIVSFAPVLGDRQNKTPRDLIHRIQVASAKAFEIPVAEIISDRREKVAVKARHVAIYLCKTFSMRSYPEIAKRFGNRDHSTAIHACNKIDRIMKADTYSDQDNNDIREAVTYLKHKFETAIRLWRQEGYRLADDMKCEDRMGGQDSALDLAP